MQTDRRSETGSPERARRSPLLHVPPPLLFIAAFLLGWLVLHERVLPFPLAPARWDRALDIAGLAVAAAGALLGLACLALFARQRTTILPPGQPSSLVLRGPYTFTRNPMYVALTLAYLGATLIFATAWPLLLLPLPLLVLDRVVIPFEERRLLGIFGDEYRRFMERVPRWL